MPVLAYLHVGSDTYSRKRPTVLVAKQTNNTLQHNDCPKATTVIPLDQAVDTIRLSDKGSYYILELNAPPDNRLTPSFITAFIEALDTLKFYYDPKPLVTTSTSPKFYSNGLDYELAQKTPIS